MLSALNYLAVFLYGLFIVFFLLGIKMNRQNFIAISAYLVSSLIFQFLLYFTNSFAGEVTFKDDLPVTDAEHHGFGTKSIAAAVQKYKGIYSFTAKDGVFRMNAIL